MRPLKFWRERLKKIIGMALLALTVVSFAKPKSEAAPPLIAMLNNFLAAASHAPPTVADKEIFNQFFADDVIYTRATGVVITKAEIMHSLDQPPSAGDPVASYSAEDVTVKQYGNVAIIAFRLVQKLPDGSNKVF